jgi:hypothetical protein
MKDIIVQNWGWITYIVMAVVPILVGLLTKAKWPSVVKALLVGVMAVVVTVARMEVGDLPWTAVEVGPFFGSLLGAAWVAYIGLIKSFPTVQKWLDTHLVK